MDCPFSIAQQSIGALSNIECREVAKAEHRKVEIEALTAEIQKVSAQLEASKPAPQVVNNP